MTKQAFLEGVAARNASQPEFLQAVKEVVESVWEIYEENPIFQDANILERLVEPERTIMFRVPWVNDAGEVKVNRGYRIEFNSAIGPYKGGLRFHPSVNLSILKFLGFEQIFKNALTTLPMGGGKGGSDFDAKGKSEGEIMRFCQSFMTELFRHIGNRTDIPAGDIGVGAREIGFLYGQYKRIRNEFTGVLTGKGLNWGGSLVRPEATGYGVVYFANEMLKNIGQSLEGKVVAISGFGNVAWGAATKVNDLGGKVVTLSGPDGYIYDPDGIRDEKINYMLMLRASNNDIIEPYVREFPKAKFFPKKRPWEQTVDVALPCATQNELEKKDAEMLLKNGCKCVVEGANMPSTPDAVELLEKARILYAPGKAANAGGVATSGLEMTQNYMGQPWPRERVDNELRQIMIRIHEQCKQHGRIDDHYVDYVRGANIAGFMKVARAMVEQGVV
ncbi:MAG: NADP-specific glutamate dehydrogenase [Candidatus Neomarinimicrobiota bacterium]|jgi:glutamate dehydrogenase (NADP+)|nr:NADP-specific glutamate dehydrogenase [Candidatus Neomarinimicrobiota bacterium]MDD3965868.1 NADP-specific glutamate dehydrogenase [Candidatus Neomarinimicrobiota bacterium]MDX9780066.1 NADP-specific glutamate dehydrogenase [bacterium]